jgi:hypothetical protein
MSIRGWVLGGVAAATALAGCGGTTRTTARSTASTASTAASTPSPARLPPGASPALRGVFGRVLAASELAGFRPQGRRLLGINATGWVVETEVPASRKAQETARLQGLGFVAAVKERLIPRNGMPAEGLSIVEQFRSPSGAGAELATESRLLKAGGAVTTFSVTGIPGAIGAAGSRPENSGENIAFTRGSYYYLVGAGWRTGIPSPPTRAALIAAAQRLYGRVHA